MSSSGTVVLRRTWPQRILILCALAVIGAGIGASWFLNDVYASVSELGRVEFAADVLLTDTAPGEPVNFLLIGEDSALGLDPDDPATFAREVDPRMRFQADSITILRVNPATGQAWVLSLPRDLLVDDRGTERRINSLLLVEGHELLVETITANFGITLNHYMSLDFLGFREVVDELDGIPVWFDNPARDINLRGEPGSGLDIPTAGCQVLDGEQALQYVRSRGYQELIDGEWQYIGSNDFGRVERQQDFLVLALDRAIDRGARNPATLASLIRAAASSIVLDKELTVAELIDVGEAFSDFNPENLERYELQVETVGSGADYQGERAMPGANDAVFAIFRGEADLLAPEDVSFALYGAGAALVTDNRLQLEGEGFAVERAFVVDVTEADTVVVHPTGQRAAAETIARYLEPIPRLVEDPDADEVSVLLGADHEQVLFFYPHEVSKMRAAAAAHPDGETPNLETAVEIGTTASAPTPTVIAPTTEPASTVPTVTSTTSLSITSPSLDGGDRSTDGGVASGPSATRSVIGRPPEGQSCG